MTITTTETGSYLDPPSGRQYPIPSAPPYFPVVCEACQGEGHWDGCTDCADVGYWFDLPPLEELTSEQLAKLTGSVTDD